MSAPATPLIAWSRRFAASPPQIREARLFLATILEGCPVADDALLCLSELATNALLHSRSREPGGYFTVHAQRQGDDLRVEVRDQGGPWTSPALTNSGEMNGRGLAIVGQLARAWGRCGDEAGWTVWFEIGQGPAQRWVTLLDGHRLRRLRHHYGLTQAELAAKARLSSATVARLERGTCLACRCRTVARLAAALDIGPTTLIFHLPPHRQTAIPGSATNTSSAT
jgi:serine/threonine-protein kinase RsbW